MCQFVSERHTHTDKRAKMVWVLEGECGMRVCVCVREDRILTKPSADETAKERKSNVGRAMKRHCTGDCSRQEL